ncbi:MAG: hypothetical protein K2Y71_29025 [Xanthobacteraceae bacterium]|nr:hypothetical protein [Xanthobacteraceae bacterium]
MDRRDWLIVFAPSAALMAILWGSGWTAPWINPDTAGYLRVAAYPAFYAEQRIPLYGWLVAALGGENGLSRAVWLQLVVHVGASALLYASIRRLGAGRAAAFALFLPALFSQSFLIFGRGISPESFAVSLTLIAMSATLLAVPEGRRTSCLLLAGITGAVACLLRPIMLPLVVMLPVLFALASRITGRRVAPRSAIALLLLLALPLSLYAADRARHTGDFKLVAFGGFTLAGMAGLMLSQDIVQKLPAAERELAMQVLSAREQAEAAGRVSRTPLNSKGERSFVSAAAGYFDIYARSYDDLLYGEITKLRSPGESWVAFDRRLQRLALATIALAPERYGAWIVGASSRLIGRMIVTNAPFVLASMALLVTLLLMLYRPESVRNLRGSTDTLLVVAVVLVYVLIAAPLAVLITFPASRYIDTAAVLLPALPLFGAIRLGMALAATPRPKGAL